VLLANKIGGRERWALIPVSDGLRLTGGRGRGDSILSPSARTLKVEMGMVYLHNFGATN